MGMKKKPTKLKLVKGNPGRRPIKGNEPEPEIVQAPKPPGWLDNNALAVWDVTATELDRIGMLTKVDLIALSHYCDWHSTYLWASRDIEMNGMILEDSSGRRYRNPATTIKNEASRHVRSYAAEFGLTCSARSGMVIATGRRNADDDKAAKAARILDKK